MIRKWAALMFCLTALFSLAACGNKPPKNQDAGGLKISVTFNAMKEFVAAVGGDKVEISTIIPDGSEAHGFEPKPQDMAFLTAADIIVYNGLNMEPWVEEAIQSAKNDKLIVVDASAGADIIVKEDEEAHEEHEGEEVHNEDEEEHSHGKYDPHLWLGLTGARTQVTNIKDALVKADPANEAYYEKNYTAYISQLESLFNEYNEKFKTIENKNFVTGHEAFGYLCRDFGLVQNSVRDLFAEGEPSAQQLVALVEYCKAHNVTTIFSEELASPAVSKTLADEVGAKVETIFTMESSENGKSYLERMTENLSRIYASLS